MCQYQKICFSALLFFLSTIFSSAQQSAVKFFDDRNVVENWLKENKIPCLGIGILREGELREIRLYGEIKKGIPAPHNTIFNIASLTKPIVTMLTLKLVSLQEWSLDEPLYPYYVDPDIATDLRHKKITTRIILSHQTGFPNWREQNPGGRLGFIFDPGTKFGYSGEGFEYLRKALEKKFNTDLHQLADSLIFRPLGMHDTQFEWDSQTDESRFAHWFDKNGDEYIKDFKDTRMNAADDVLTTIEDYGNFGSWILKGAGMDTAIYNQIFHPHIPTKDGRFMCLGWEVFLNLGVKKEPAIIHTGSDTGTQTLIILLPVSGQGLIIFTNSDNGEQVYRKIISELLDVGQEMVEQVK